MKAVQAGILIALIVVGVLLFLVYRDRNPSLPKPAEPPAETAAHTAVAPAPVESAAAPASPPATAQAPPRTAAKPSPAALSRRTGTVAPAGEAPQRESEPPRTTPAAEPPARAATPVPEAEPSAALATTPSTGAAERASPPVAAAPPRTVTVAAGTLISARLAETLSTENVKAGDSFTATLDRPLVVDGLVIAERGARVEGQVTEAAQSGRVRGVASLAIRLTRLLTSDGQRVDIQTDAFKREAESTRREDAIKVGGGAGIGAAIGAIAGGGKGAAIGAAIGGAAGAGTVAATRGKPAVLSVETRIDFRVSEPFTLTERK
ncbi:MAG: hypothetical protein IT159_05085 [Bryobacterales bacterium]|nr:hypothetical protein [Bryobacterales bacterium]